MTLFEAWLIFTSPNLAMFVGVTSMVAGSLAAIAIVLLTIEVDSGLEDASKLKWRPIALKVVAVCVVTGFLSAAYPTETQMYAIVGGHYGTNIEGVEELPENTVRYLNKQLTEHLEKE